MSTASCNINNERVHDMPEVVALEQQRLVRVDGERVGEAVAEVELRRMPGALVTDVRVAIAG